MAGLVTDTLPLWQIIRSLFFNICLRKCAVRAVEFLHDGILDADALDSVVEFWEGVDPMQEKRVHALAQFVWIQNQK